MAWCYIDGMVCGLVHAMVPPIAVGETFNIENNRAVTTTYGLANTVIRVLGSASQIRFVPRASAHIELRVPRHDNARAVLGFEPLVGLEEGIRRMADYFSGTHPSNVLG
jgi:UDP-glucose 4-epimerase